MYEYATKKTSDLIPYVNNSRTHSDEQIAQVASSIKEFGFTNPILVDEQGGIIAGHGRLLAAQKLGLDEVPCITLVGLSEAQKKAYVIADNQLALNAGWDLGALKLEVEHLQELDFDIGMLGFDDDFIGDLLDSDDQSEADSPYTSRIDAPTYEPKNEKPPIDELISTEKTLELIKAINAANISDDERRFLIMAAERHTVFDFSKIADYYAQSAPDVQSLMESSALVIVDFDKAIESGFVSISQAINDQYGAEVNG